MNLSLGFTTSDNASTSGLVSINDSDVTKVTSEATVRLENASVIDNGLLSLPLLLLMKYSATLNSG